MKRVSKIAIVLLALVGPFMMALAMYGFIEPYASVHTAYGGTYWLFMAVLFVCLFWSPVIYALATGVTIKYNQARIVTSFRIKGFWIRLIVGIAGIVLIGLVLEDFLSLYYAEILLGNPATYLNSNGVVWSAMGDMLLGTGIPAYITLINNIQIPTMYIVFTVLGGWLITLALLFPRNIIKI